MVLDKKCNLQDLKNLLSNYNIDHNLWGSGPTKSIEQLLNEIHLGDCVLGLSNGNLTRFVSVAALDIFFKKEERIFELFEKEQVFTNGSKRVRNLNSSLAEKIQFNEKIEDTLVRMLHEELGLKIALERFSLTTMSRTDSNISKSYPGLYSQFSFKDYHLFLQKNEFNQNGYIENQSDKKTYFEWREVVPA